MEELKILHQIEIKVAEVETEGEEEVVFVEVDSEIIMSFNSFKN